MEKALERQIRRHLVVFVVALALSGITAIPLESESAWAVQFLDWFGVNNAFSGWLHIIHNGIAETAQRYPFIGYGTDWLAFGHVVIAIFFIGPNNRSGSEPLGDRGWNHCLCTRVSACVHHG
jgi:hypothetical protein